MIQNLKIYLKKKIKKKINDIVQQCLKWIDEHPNADKDEYDNKRKELEQIWRPIITAAYGQDGQQDRENFGQSSSNDDTGAPKIDEVD